MANKQKISTPGVNEARHEPQIADTIAFGSERKKLFLLFFRK
jgi:hypothetical protein